MRWVINATRHKFKMGLWHFALGLIPGLSGAAAPIRHAVA